MHLKRFSLFCAWLLTAKFALAQNFTLDSTSIGPGGSSAGGNYTLDASVGEADATSSSLNGGTYSMNAGFWGITVVPTPDGGPQLAIQSTTTNTVLISWPASAEGFELRQSSNLNTPTWTVPPQVVNTSGGSKFIIVNPPVGNLFYRLNKVVSASAYQVVNVNDAGAGSLRAAILAATNNAVVDFAPGLEGVIVLSSELAINKSLIIAGPGATVLAVSGGNTSRVFNISTGNVKIFGLAIRDGAAPSGDPKGGGVFNSTSLVLSNCALVSNLAVGSNGANGVTTIGGSGGSGFGGGIYSTGTLALVNCTLALNEARGGNGGNGGVSGSGFGLNGGAGGSGLGGAICNDGILNMTNCTFAVNRVTGGNGGIGGDGGLSVGRGGNGGGAEGAGVLNRLTCQSANVTITGGVAEHGSVGTGSPNGSPGVALGGGFRSTTANAFLVNSLIAENSLGSTIAVANGFDVFGTIVSQGYNLVGMTNGSSAWLASDKVGNNVSPVDPLLDVLQDNGGGVPTMGLLSGSPAIDQGKNIGLSTDERGLPRPVDFAGLANAAGGNGSDMGAFEVNP
jgi:hypothetical protein